MSNPATQAIPRVITGTVVAKPTVGYSKAGKAVVNIPLEVGHGHRDGGSKWAKDPSEYFDVHLWQPDNLIGTGRQQQWIKEQMDTYVPGQRTIAYGRWDAKREATRKDGSKMEIQDLTAYEIGPSTRYGGLAKDREQAIDPMQAATTAVVDGLGGVAL